MQNKERGHPLAPAYILTPCHIFYNVLNKIAPWNKIIDIFHNCELDELDLLKMPIVATKEAEKKKKSGPSILIHPVACHVFGCACIPKAEILLAKVSFSCGIFKHLV